MSIVIGGAFAAGAFANNLRAETAGVANTLMSQWLRLAPDPLGRPYNVMAARIAQRDYDDYPGLSKYRSEVAGVYTLSSWGVTYTYQWRFVAPPDYATLGPSFWVVVGQVHDVNAGAVGRQPTLAIEYSDGTLRVRNSFDAYPTGQVLYTTPYVAGTEYELTIRVRWADGTNAPDADGYFELYHGDRLVASFTGRNTWAGNASTEPNPPYIKGGVYQSGYGYPAWQGKAASIYYVAAAAGTGDETPASMRAQVDAQLAANPATVRLLKLLS